MSGKNKPTIGLEVHAELKTHTKMFCGCKNAPKEAPNTNICPVCTAQPGTLPVPNKDAIRQMIRIGHAVGGTIADFSEFDRKNYFYPDIPKGYQITQYKYPFVSGGSIAGVALTRIHLEEDTASSVHDKNEMTLVDYNRAGVPLMELVTEPVIHSAEDAVRFAKELQLLLRTLGASDANMEEGQMRVEANISISATDKFGTKVEVKNLNSFRAVEGAIRYEIARHEEVLEEGEVIVQETRGWNEDTQSTFSQRKKENAHDYRYFPEPDIPKMKISEVPELKNLEATLPELPWQKRKRLIEEIGLTPETTEIFVADALFGEFFDEAAKVLGGNKDLLKLSSNYISSDIVGLAKNSGGVGKLTATAFAVVIQMLKKGDLSSRGAKDLISYLFAEGGEPESIAQTKGLIQKSDPEALKKIIQEIISANPKAVVEFKSGKEASLQFLVGQGMRASKGSANPQILAELFKTALK